MCVDPATAPAPAESTYYGDGQASSADQAAAFPHYADGPVTAAAPPAPAPAPTTGAPAEPETTAQRDLRLRAEVDKLKQDPEKFAEADKKAKELASKLATEITKPHLFGANTEVTDCLQGLSPAEVQLVKDNYAAQYKSLGNENKNLEADLREKLDGKDLAVADAVMSGDKVKAATAFVDQAASGAGTDTDTWKKALANLDSKEREQFVTQMDKKLGKPGAYAEMLREETSSFERDELSAMTIVNDDERAAKLAQVKVSENSFGGQYTRLNEGLHDSIGDLIGEDDADRRERRQAFREYDIFTQYSNAGGGEDETLDALEQLKSPEQAKLFKQQMLAENGETADTTFDGELSRNHNESAKAFAEGDYNEGIAQRMVGDARNYVDDREDGMSKGFESVRLSSDQETDIAKGKTPEERAELRKQAEAVSRSNLRERTNKIAEDAGFGGYDQLLADELSPEQLDAAKDRMKTGKVSEVNQLLAAGDGVGGTGLGKDTDTFYRVMQDKTPKEMETLEAEFDAKKGKGAFKEFLAKKATSEGERRDFEIMREGNIGNMSPEEQAKLAAEHPEKMIKRVKDLHKAAKGGVETNWYDPLSWEQAAGNEIGNAIADNHGDIGARTDARAEAVDAMQKKLDAKQELTPAEQEELQQHVRFMTGDQKQYTATKTEAARAVAEGAGAVAEVATIAATGNKDAAAFVGSVVEIGVEQRLDPARMSQDRILQKSVQAVGEYAVSAAGGAAFPDELVKGKPGLELVKDMVEGAGEGVVTAVADPKNLTDPGRLADAAARNAGDGMTEAAASAAAGGVVPEGDTRVHRAVKQVAESTAEQVSTGDLSRSGGEIMKDIGKDALKGMAKDEAGEHHKRSELARQEAPLDNLDENRPPRPINFDYLHQDIETQPRPEAGERVDMDSLITPAPDPAYGPPVVHADPLANLEDDGPSAPLDIDQAIRGPKPEPAPVERVNLDSLITPAPDPAYGPPAVDVDPLANLEEGPVSPVDIDQAIRGIEPEPESTPSAFGEESIERRKPQITAPDGTRARLVGDQLLIKFVGEYTDEGFEIKPTPEERAALAKDAAERLGLVPAPGSQLVVDKDGIGSIDRQLTPATADKAVAALNRIYMTDEAKEARKGDTQDSLESSCEKTALEYQATIAEQGMFATVVMAKSPDMPDHKFLIVGDRIIDPSIGQFLDGKDANENEQREPFIGTYDDLVKRLAARLPEGTRELAPLPGETEEKLKRRQAMDVIQRQWGIEPTAPGEPIQRTEYVKDVRDKGIKRTNVVDPVVVDPETIIDEDESQSVP